MPETNLDRLRRAVRQRDTLVVVGAGIAFGATGRDEALWKGLLAHGIDHCAGHLEGLPSGWAKRKREDLAEGDDTTLVSVAEEITTRLSSAGPSAFGNWLEATAGSFEARAGRDGALAALGDLPGPLATTNYDDLLEDALEAATGSRPPAVTWKDPPERVLEVLRGTEPGVLHLHGHWKRPESIVLGLRSYDQLTREEAFQAVQQATGLYRSWVFVGCGGTLDDPNLGALFRWLTRAFPNQRPGHFRLAPRKELATLRKRHSADRIEPVECDHDALPAFLAELSKASAEERKELPGAEAAAEPPDLGNYLENLVRETDHVRIGGLVRRARGALNLPIEELYTPLSATLPPAALSDSLAELLADRDRSTFGETAGAGPPPGFDAVFGRFGASSRGIALPKLLPGRPRLLLEGQPGAGKTTFLRYTACMLARDHLGRPGPGGRSWRQAYLGLDPLEPAPVPLLVRLARLASLLTADDAPKHLGDNRRWLLELLERTSRDNGFGLDRSAFEELLEEGRALLLLDGLDEVADLDLRGRLFGIFRDACESWPGPIVVASRPLLTQELKELGFAVATVEPFGKPEIETFIDHWVRLLHPSHGASHPEELPAGPAGNEREALTSAILTRPRVRRMASNPIMLTCLAVVHWNEGELPEGRSRVYGAVIGWLLKSREEQRKAAGFDNLFAEQAFLTLALAMSADPRGKRSQADLEEAIAAVEPVVARRHPHLDHDGRRAEARRWLLFEGAGSGIVEELPGAQLRFWHLTFQEYLAARALAWRETGRDDPEKDWWPVISEHLEDAQWREIVDLFPGCLLDEGGVGRVDRLLARVTEVALGAPPGNPDVATGLAARARAAGLLGRLLRPLTVLDYRPAPEIATTHEACLEEALAIFEAEGAAQVPFEVRLAAAEALGRAGDPRLEPEVDNLLEIPGTGGVRLGRYPVTVFEYHRFWETGGYDDRNAWSDEGWRERQERGWEEPGGWAEQLDHPSRPVTGVSWYEAEAYCRRLSELRGIDVRLPDDDAWQAAATAKVGDYPWGPEEPDEERANFERGRDGAPTPVGLYPRGRGPAGHDDLAGNVWEWCSDEVPIEEVPEGLREHYEGEVLRRLRGGGWRDSAESLRSALRSGAPPGSASALSASVSPSRPRALDL